LNIDHWLWLSAAVAFAAFVQGTTGVGFALLVAPICGLLEPSLLPVGVLVLMLPLNAYVAWRERGAVDGASAGWITAGRAVGTGGGVAVLALLSSRQLGMFVSGSILAAVAATLLAPSFKPGRLTLIPALIRSASASARRSAAQLPAWRRRWPRERLSVPLPPFPRHTECP
jgi:uncharacterized membrane protein YfcA